MQWIIVDIEGDKIVRFTSRTKSQQQATASYLKYLNPDLSWNEAMSAALDFNGYIYPADSLVDIHYNEVQ